jgi:hypothetical protein
MHAVTTIATSKGSGSQPGAVTWNQLLSVHSALHGLLLLAIGRRQMILPLILPALEYVAIIGPSTGLPSS